MTKIVNSNIKTILSSLEIIVFKKATLYLHLISDKKVTDCSCSFIFIFPNILVRKLRTIMMMMVIIIIIIIKIKV